MTKTKQTIKRRTLYRLTALDENKERIHLTQDDTLTFPSNVAHGFNLDGRLVIYLPGDDWEQENVTLLGNSIEAKLGYAPILLTGDLCEQIRFFRVELIEEKAVTKKGEKETPLSKRRRLIIRGQDESNDQKTEKSVPEEETASDAGEGEVPDKWYGDGI